MKKQTRVVSNDSTHLVSWVGISANVILKGDSSFSVRVSPSALDFSPVDLGKNPELEARIRNTTATDLRMRIADWPAKFVKAKLSGETIKPSGEVTLQVKLKKEAVSLRWTKSITLELDNDNRDRLSIPIKK
ncbi:MAG: hypothetical protein WCE90_05295 [Candidatus Zixiibacteriota bacterium]